MNSWIRAGAIGCILVILSPLFWGCGDHESGWEGETASLRKVLQKVELPPLGDDLPDKGGSEASGNELPDIKDLEARAPDLPDGYRQLPDFAGIRDVEEKKRRFFEYMRGLLRVENARIRRERYRLIRMHRAFLRGDSPEGRDRDWLRELCRRYRESFEGGVDSKLFRNLLIKLDIVPVELGVAQAANESAWGTSRFAMVGNNLFGQWCFEQGCGLVPLRRSPGSNHEVEAYANPRLSVRDYMQNLNSHPAYREFRITRYRQRRSDSGLDGSELAEGLLAYSGIGREYVHRLRSIMKQYVAYRQKVVAQKEAEGE